MCLAMPVEVIALKDYPLAIVSIGGVEKEISIALVDNVQVGDYVILHVGYALSKLDVQEAQKTLALLNEIIEK